MSDVELVELARGGDARAFGELVERHQRAVVRAAMAVLHDADEAKDVAQDAFVLAYQRLGSFRGDASFKTWMLTITWHEAINRRRSLIRRLTKVMRLDDVGPLGDDAPTAATRSLEQAFVGIEHASHVRRLVLALPKRYREPLLLAAGGDCTFEEMSSMLGVAVGTLKWRVHRARTKLRAELEKLGYQQ